MHNTPYLEQRRNFNVSENESLRVCIEMHRSMWTDEFKKHTCRDLAGGGLLFEDPDLLSDSSEYVKDCVRNGRYIITPMPWTYYYERKSVLQGYIYVFDGPLGMQIGFDSNEVRK